MEKIIEFINTYAEWLSIIIGLFAILLTALPLIKRSRDSNKSMKNNVKKNTDNDKYTVTITNNKLIGKNKISVNVSEANINEIKNAVGGDISINNPIQTILNPPNQTIGPNANLEGAILSRTNLEGEDLGKANLRKAILTESNLSYTNLFGANLEGANLESSNLYKANLRQTNLKGANLINAFLEDISLDGAIYDKDTQWPNQYDPIERGALLEK